MKDWLTAVFLVIGGLFMLLAAIGLVRLPDVFTRMHATTKAATAGLGATFVAVAVYFASLSVSARSLLIIAFIFLTAPLAAHMIGRAAYAMRTPLFERTVTDELDGQYRPADEEKTIFLE
jgi:multicomponent Na+:H+ antiporter subunit G